MRTIPQSPLLEQLDLFRPPGARLSWEKLPVDVRQAVIGLLAKMVRDYQMCPIQGPQREEASGE